jgi:hypothetical protein
MSYYDNILCNKGRNKSSIDKKYFIIYLYIHVLIQKKDGLYILYIFLIINIRIII